MFLDESGDHNLEKIDPSYPVFVLTGCIFDLDYYNATAEKAVSDLKQKYFGHTDIILRSYDIRKQKGDFSVLVDKKKRDLFYGELNALISKLDFTVITAVIEKNRLKGRYTSPDNPYHLCFRFILERAAMYLGRGDGKLLFRIESRETHNDRKLADEYEKFRSGTQHFPAAEVQSKFVDLSFNQKTQNIAGMQLADLVAYPIGKWVMDKTKENKPFELIESKLHKKNGKYENCGLKIFPWNKRVGPGKP